MNFQYHFNKTFIHQLINEVASVFEIDQKKIRINAEYY